MIQNLIIFGCLLFGLALPASAEVIASKSSKAASTHPSRPAQSGAGASTASSETARFAPCQTGLIKFKITWDKDDANHSHSTSAPVAIAPITSAPTVTLSSATPSEAKHKAATPLASRTAAKQPSLAKASIVPANSKHLTPPVALASGTPVPTPISNSKKHVLPVVALSQPSASSRIKSGVLSAMDAASGHLARLTAYWASEGDYYTKHCLSATGIHLHGGLCAVDPRIIPYGSVVQIAGVGTYLAVDTGSAVISREAAKEAGHNIAERSALVIDLFFEHRSEGERFAANGPKFAAITWWTPSAMDHEAREARGLFAEEDWNKIFGKQL